MYDFRCTQLPSGNQVALKVANYSTKFQMENLDTELNHLRLMADSSLVLQLRSDDIIQLGASKAGFITEYVTYLPPHPPPLHRRSLTSPRPHSVAPLVL